MADGPCYDRGRKAGLHMDVQSLITGFLASSQGQSAVAALGNHGIAGGDAEAALGHATQAVATHVSDQHPKPEEGLLGSLLGDHAGRNFLAGLAAGLAKGDGLVGALEDGAMGVVTGRVTEALVEKAGMDGGMASTIAAAATPYITSYLKEKLGSGAS